MGNCGMECLENDAKVVTIIICAENGNDLFIPKVSIMKNVNYPPFQFIHAIFSFRKFGRRKKDEFSRWDNDFAYSHYFWAQGPNFKQTEIFCWKVSREFRSQKCQRARVANFASFLSGFLPLSIVFFFCPRFFVLVRKQLGK